MPLEGERGLNFEAVSINKNISKREHETFEDVTVHWSKLASFLELRLSETVLHVSVYQLVFQRGLVRKKKVPRYHLHFFCLINKARVHLCTHCTFLPLFSY